MCLAPLARAVIGSPAGKKVLPQPPETAPRAEKTAKSPVLGRKRTTASRKSSKTKAARRFGTRSLRIPLRSSGNLNY